MAAKLKHRPLRRTTGHPRSLNLLHRRVAASTPYLPIFVYGALLPGSGTFDDVLADAVTATAPADLPGAVLLDYQQYPYAVRTGQLSDLVIGTLVHLRPDAYPAALARLDRTFGCAADAPDARWSRRRVTIRGGGAAQDAWVYVAADWLAPLLLATLPAVPSGDWSSHVTSRSLALSQVGPHGVGEHDGQGITWGVLNPTRAGASYHPWPNESVHEVFTHPGSR